MLSLICECQGEDLPGKKNRIQYYRELRMFCCHCSLLYIVPTLTQNQKQLDEPGGAETPNSQWGR